MNVLSDVGIARRFEAGDTLVWPCKRSACQPASVDLRLGDRLRLYHAVRSTTVVIDPDDPTDHTVEVSLGASFDLDSYGFALAATLERISVPKDLVGILVGRSTLARRGLQIEAAGLLDPGWYGHPTLELFNAAPYPIRLRPGMAIGQVLFLQLDHKCERPYGHPDLGSKYQDDRVPTAAKVRP